MLQDAYATLNRTMNARVNLLNLLDEMRPPTTDAELNALEKVLSEYRNLIEATKRASDQLAKYLKAWEK